MDARAQELCALLKKALRDMGVRPEARPAVYLTGGGIAMMHGIGEYLNQQLGFHVRRDMPSYMHEMNSPNYTSAFGALDLCSAPARKKPRSLRPRIRSGPGCWINSETY